VSTWKWVLLEMFLRCLACALAVGLGFGVFCLSIAASPQEDAAADAVATAFINARQAANLPKLERMGRNTFQEKICKHDLRFPSGLINNVLYETSDPAQLPESAQKLAISPDKYKTATRFGVGVCLKTGPPGQPTYSVVVATYESRATSFLRIFWE
jgi:hypothetical protein